MEKDHVNIIKEGEVAYKIDNMEFLKAYLSLTKSSLQILKDKNGEVVKSMNLKDCLKIQTKISVDDDYVVQLQENGQIYSFKCDNASSVDSWVEVLNTTALRSSGRLLEFSDLNGHVVMVHKEEGLEVKSGKINLGIIPEVQFRKSDGYLRYGDQMITKLQIGDIKRLETVIKEFVLKSGAKFTYIKEMKDFSDFDKQFKQLFVQMKTVQTAFSPLIIQMIFDLPPSSLNLQQKFDEICQKGKMEKTICGKIVKTVSIIFQCKDCQIHPDAMWCKECFEEGDHEGHDFSSSRNLGVCDCGDSSNVKVQGFCKSHKGQSVELKQLPDIIDKDIKHRIVKVFLSYFHCYFQFIEAQKFALRDKNLLQRLMLSLEEVKEIMTKFCTDNPYFSYLFYMIIFNTFDKAMTWINGLEGKGDQDKFCYGLKHKCKNLKENEATQEPQACECTILELCYRYSAYWPRKYQRGFLNFLFVFLRFDHMKMQFVKTFVKMFPFVLCIDPLNPNKWIQTDFLEFHGQSQAAEVLDVIIESKHFPQVIDTYKRNMNTLPDPKVPFHAQGIFFPLQVLRQNIINKESSRKLVSKKILFTALFDIFFMTDGVHFFDTQPKVEHRDFKMKSLLTLITECHSLDFFEKLITIINRQEPKFQETTYAFIFPMLMEKVKKVNYDEYLHKNHQSFSIPILRALAVLIHGRILSQKTDNNMSILDFIQDTNVVQKVFSEDCHLKSDLWNKILQVLLKVNFFNRELSLGVWSAVSEASRLLQQNLNVKKWILHYDISLTQLIIMYKSSTEDIKLNEEVLINNLSSQDNFSTIIESCQSFAYAAKNLNQQMLLSYFHLFGSLMINKFSLPYLMIRLGDNSQLYSKNLAELLIQPLISAPPQTLLNVKQLFDLWLPSKKDGPQFSMEDILPTIADYNQQTKKFTLKNESVRRYDFFKCIFGYNKLTQEQDKLLQRKNDLMFKDLNFDLGTFSEVKWDSLTQSVARFILQNSEQLHFEKFITMEDNNLKSNVIREVVKTLCYLYHYIAQFLMKDEKKKDPQFISFIQNNLFGDKTFNAFIMWRNEPSNPDSILIHRDQSIKTILDLFIKAEIALGIKPHKIPENFESQGIHLEEEKEDMSLDNKKLLCQKRQAEVRKKFEAKRKKFQEQAKERLDQVEKNTEKCPMCHSNIKDEPYGCLAFLSTSNLYKCQMLKKIEDKYGIDDSEEVKEQFLNGLKSLHMGYCFTNITSCGHKLHKSCYLKYQTSLVRQQQKRGRLEFYCQICRQLGNIFIQQSEKPIPSSQLTFMEFFQEESELKEQDINDLVPQEKTDQNCLTQMISELYYNDPTLKQEIAKNKILNDEFNPDYVQNIVESLLFNCLFTSSIVTTQQFFSECFRIYDTVFDSYFKQYKQCVHYGEIYVRIQNTHPDLDSYMEMFLKQEIETNLDIMLFYFIFAIKYSALQVQITDKHEILKALIYRRRNQLQQLEIEDITLQILPFLRKIVVASVLVEMDSIKQEEQIQILSKGDFTAEKLLNFIGISNLFDQQSKVAQLSDRCSKLLRVKAGFKIEILDFQENYSIFYKHHQKRNCVICKQNPPKESHFTCLLCNITFCQQKCGNIKGMKFRQKFVGNLMKHARSKHAGQCVIFDLNSGAVTLISNRERNDPKFLELYQNKYGLTVQKDQENTKDFGLQTEELKRLENIICLQNYDVEIMKNLRKKHPGAQNFTAFMKNF